MCIDIFFYFYVINQLGETFSMALEVQDTAFFVDSNRTSIDMRLGNDKGGFMLAKTEWVLPLSSSARR